MSLPKECAHCGTAFAKDPRNSSAYWARAKFCGQACAGAANSLRLAAQRVPMREKFDQQVCKTDGCWLWTGLKDKDGYGLFPFGRVQHRANRVALELDGRPVPAGQYACHDCDTPACVRPDHLYPGTPTQNMKDARERGRTKRGERQHMAKLTDDAVREIRASELSAPALAAQFKVSRAAIHFVLKGKTWRHVA